MKSHANKKGILSESLWRRTPKVRIAFVLLLILIVITFSINIAIEVIMNEELKDYKKEIVNASSQPYKLSDKLVTLTLIENIFKGLSGFMILCFIFYGLFKIIKRK
jgi:hypothetical protein